ncbi:hypothetical protein CPB86DRAFT_736931 [Serendipita vermifera]|nr:hypothetical protein CPB86DRAFT_736931 [Serendipita vermifera]
MPLESHLSALFWLSNQPPISTAHSSDSPRISTLLNSQTRILHPTHLWFKPTNFSTHPTLLLSPLNRASSGYQSDVRCTSCTTTSISHKGFSLPCMYQHITPGFIWFHRWDGVRIYFYRLCSLQFCFSISLDSTVSVHLSVFLLPFLCYDSYFPFYLPHSSPTKQFVRSPSRPIRLFMVSLEDPTFSSIPCVCPVVSLRIATKLKHQDSFCRKARLTKRKCKSLLQEQCCFYSSASLICYRRARSSRF